MAEPFLAEIRMFPFNFAPRGWAFCDGQLMALSQNTALFALLGATYGGNGKSTFALPNLQGSAPMHPGQGPGLSSHELGERAGAETVTLLSSQMPGHSHGLGVWAGDPADHFDPTNMTFARSNNGQAWGPPTTLAPMSPAMIVPVGGGEPHNNMMPYLTLNFCIALQGVFPPRS